MAVGVPRFRQDWLLLVGLFCFFFSGAAGLIYQVVWTRMLSQIFGNTTYAIATVLSAFMAGLAIGSYWFGKIADRGKNDFLLYGVLEFGVGVYGFLVPWFFAGAQKVYGPIFSLNESQPFLFNLFLFFLSFVLLVFPTLLMGATLPVLSRFFVRSFAQFGRRVGDLYATNTLGAVIGCALGGFYLIPVYGMRATVYVAAGVNMLIAIVILIVDRLRDPEPVAAEAEAAARSRDAASAAAQSSTYLDWVLLGSFALSGFASLVYENAWTRSLTLVIGSSIYSFTTMLVTFLVGLALGGFIYARVLGNREARLSTFGLVEIWVGLSALATIPLFERLPLIFVRLLHGFGDTFTVFLYLQIFLSALVMFIPTILLGMTFPLVARLFTQSLYRVGSGVGSSYAANTVGAVLGAFAGGFILIPHLGVQNTIICGVVLNLVIGCWLIVSDSRLSFLPRYALGIAVLILAAIIPFKVKRWDPSILTSGVTIYNDRYEALPSDSLRIEEMKRDEVLFYREGLTTTVSVHKILGSDYIYFKSNGKIDGSYGDALSQLMTSYIAMMLHPKAETALTIGLGSGMSAKALATFKSLKDIEVIEIEPAMIEASKFFDRQSVRVDKFPAGVTFPADDSSGRVWFNAAEKRLYYKGVMSDAARTELMNRSDDKDYRGMIDRLYRNARHSRHSSVLEDKRVRVIPTDGRNYILATPKFYDVITAEPSNPWIAGIANLYTREFYQVIKSKIKDDGIFAQWFHNYSMSPDDFRMVFRTFAEAFPHVSLWSMKESDFLLIGSKQEQKFDYPAVKAIFDSNEMLRSDFQYLGLSDVYAVQGFYRMGRDGFLAFSKGAKINTDDGAELEFSAPKNLRRATTELNRRIMTPHLADGGPPWLKKGSLPVPQAMHHFYLAQSYEASVARNRALTELEEAIRLEPTNPKFQLLKMKILLEQDKSTEGAQAAFKALEHGTEYIPEVLAMSDEFYLPDAKLVYKKVIDMGSKEVLPYLGLGNIALHSGDIAEAEKWFIPARELQPEHPAVLLAWGRLTAAKGNRTADAAQAKKERQEARRLLELSKTKGEESATIFTELGAVYSKLEMWDKAAENYEVALRMRRRRNDLRMELGKSYAKLGRTVEAEQKFRQVLAFSPDDADAWHELQLMGKAY
ncbi:MAG TPA: fused MFS/spermidine synthase [Candidatus Limnocylindria bacterium]|nr:fused MFS/spermidine synthase [Candidatus Limnocylindria bacterium]